MDARDELIDLLGQVKEQLINSKEIGLDAPILSTHSLQYLRKGPQLDIEPLKEKFYCNSLEELENFINNCDRCRLSKERKNIVFGEGPPNARLVFVGEAPGMEEDLTGRPFVGQAGKLLTNIIKAMGLTRDEVYICNIVKCHPPRNRDPERDEIEMCLPFLEAQLSLIQPEIICAIGRISAQSLVREDFKITRERGQWQSFRGIPLMPTYHPAYLLRYPQAKKAVWEDMQEIMKRLGLKDPRELSD
ncbi:MAG: uracil-DNA glycosylase [Deltaproteobacteria bacterium]|nr:uracil-DNA glycosylase [Deltaproteobacteria bacterium]